MLSEQEFIDNPFKFAGQYGIMHETGQLFYMRARYYDAQIGRFISEDPSGFIDGPNLFAYVANNPINFVDPLGLYKYETTSTTIAFLHESNPFNTDGGFYQQANEMGKFSGEISHQGIQIGEKGWQIHQDFHQDIRDSIAAGGISSGYEGLAAFDILSLGSSFAAAGNYALAEGAVVTGTGFIILGGEIIWVGVDVLQGIGDKIKLQDSCKERKK